MGWTGLETRTLVIRLLKKQVNDVDLNKESLVIIRGNKSESFGNKLQDFASNCICK